MINAMEANQKRFKTQVDRILWDINCAIMDKINNNVDYDELSSKTQVFNGIEWIYAAVDLSIDFYFPISIMPAYVFINVIQALLDNHYTITIYDKEDIKYDLFSNAMMHDWIFDPDISADGTVEGHCVNISWEDPDTYYIIDYRDENNIQNDMKVSDNAPIITEIDSDDEI